MATKAKQPPEPKKRPAEQLAFDIIRRNDQLVASRATFSSLWQDIADYVQPRKNQILTKQNSPNPSDTANLYDTTAVEANQVMGAGQLQYVTPATERWAGFDAPETLTKKNPNGTPGPLAKWLQDCSEIVLREMARSNFYSEVHEFYLDRGAMGTAAIWVEEGKRNTFNFTALPVGSYAIAEDEEGFVDTVFREFQLTARQAAQKFGADKLGPRVKKCYDAGNEKMDEKHWYIHAVFPRTDRDMRSSTGENKPFASVYVCKDDKCVMKEGGYDEQPIMVSRYLTWGDSEYGYSPSMSILPTVRQVNFLERQMDVLAETAANPRVLVPETLWGNIDMRAGGYTAFDPNNQGAIPREWMTQGRYDIGQDRIKEKQGQIRDAYHYKLFQMFSQDQTGRMTAYETMQKVAERLVLFSPTFARLTTEFLNPLLGRLFGICWRAGLFPEAPREAYVETQRGNTKGLMLIAPQVVYTSKISLAIKALQNHAFVEFMGIIGPLVNIRPDVLDNFDLDRIVLGLARNEGFPTNWIVDEKQRDAVRQGRQKAQEAAAGLQAAQGAAKAGADLGKAPKPMQDQIMAAFSQPIQQGAAA